MKFLCGRIPEYPEYAGVARKRNHECGRTFRHGRKSAPDARSKPQAERPRANARFRARRMRVFRTDVYVCGYVCARSRIARVHRAPIYRYRSDRSRRLALNCHKTTINYSYISRARERECARVCALALATLETRPAFGIIARWSALFIDRSYFTAQ